MVGSSLTAARSADAASAASRRSDADGARSSLRPALRLSPSSDDEPRVIADVVEREVRADAQQPGSKHAGVAQLGELAHRAHERPLHQIRRLVGVAHVAQAEREQRPLMPADQPIERRPIAALRALDQHFVGRVVGLCHANQNEPWARVGIVDLASTCADRPRKPPARG